MSTLKLVKPIEKNDLSIDIKDSILLANKGAGKQLYLYTSDTISPVLIELGRLREESFRTVGLGSGKSCDIDDYDLCYEHVILWDDVKKEIMGAYRMKECDKAFESSDVSPALYTQSIYSYSDKFIEEYFHQTIEMGRVFVNRKYWGTRALDYLWHGMACYFDQKPNYHYFVCALSIPTVFSPYAKQLMVDYYSQLFPCKEVLATPLYPYKNRIDTAPFFNKLKDIAGLRPRFKFLKSYLENLGFSMPMLYKNTEIFHPDGVKFITFGHDVGFRDALDGLMLADTRRIRSLTRKRYTTDAALSRKSVIKKNVLIAEAS